MDLNISKKTDKIVISSVMMAIIMVATVFFKLPIPMGYGYVHLGDAMIFVAMFLLGKKYGAIAAVMGSMLGDLLGGFAMWALWTALAKGSMVLIAANIILKMQKCEKKGHILWGLPLYCYLAMLMGGIAMSVIYFVAEVVIYGNWMIALLVGLPFDVAQTTVGIFVATMILKSLGKTSAKRYLSINIEK